MSRKAWVEAGARVIIKRAVRTGLAQRGSSANLHGCDFTLVLDLARTTFVDVFVETVAKWRVAAEAMERRFLGTPYIDEIQNARLMIEQANLAEEVVRDLEATL